MTSRQQKEGSSMVHKRQPEGVACSTEGEDALEGISPEQVTRPGCAGAVLARHQEEAALVHRAGRPGLKKVAPYFLQRLSDERILDLAWYQLGGMEVRAPGPDGMS